jgi:hypothetical protein
MNASTLRRSQKMFIQMSRAVKTRTADQCRSHHQKILKYHNSIDETVDFFAARLSNLSSTKLRARRPKPSKFEAYSMHVEGNVVKISLNCAMIAEY